MRDGKQKEKSMDLPHIDAPEDSYGALKKQYEQLNTYGEQLGLKIAGSSSDMGGGSGADRPGLDLFLEAKDSRGIEVLLTYDFNCNDENEAEAESFSKSCVEDIRKELERKGYPIEKIRCRAGEMDMEWLEKLEDMVFSKPEQQTQSL